jgi:hypothetical protein
MSNAEMISNDLFIMICSYVVVILSALIYKYVKGVGWLLLIVGWSYMAVLRTLWFYDTLCDDFDIKSELGSYVYPHWILVIIALFVFYFEIKKVLKR